jgi:hypothetical protein
MANRILTSNTYHDEIRAQLGTDSGILLDTDIDALSVLPLAEAKVVARVPDYATLVNDDQTYLYSSAILMTAALLASSMKNRVKLQEGDSDYKYSKSDIDWDTRAKKLEADAYGFIDLISTQTIIGLAQIAVAGPTTLAQQQAIADGDPSQITPQDGDLILYPTNVE